MGRKIKLSGGTPTLASRTSKKQEQQVVVYLEIFSAANNQKRRVYLPPLVTPIEPPRGKLFDRAKAGHTFAIIPTVEARWSDGNKQLFGLSRQ